MVGTVTSGRQVSVITSASGHRPVTPGNAAAHAKAPTKLGTANGRQASSSHTRGAGSRTRVLA